MTKQKKITPGLGKGLGALIPSISFKDKGFDIQVAVEEEHSPDNEMAALIDLDKIRPNPYQPRHEFDPEALDELKKSIIEHGVISAITVRRVINGYELIAGERRLRASLAAGLKKIPAFVLDVNSDKEMLEIAIIENVQRENLNPIEIAHGYNRLIEECSMNQEDVAKRVGKDRATVANFLRLLKLPEIIQEHLRAKRLSMGHARTLLALSDTAAMIASGSEIIEKGLSVRATEQLVKDIENGRIKIGKEDNKIQEKKEKKEIVTPDIAAVLEETEDRLRQTFGTNVKIYPRNSKSGTIEFEFYSIEDFGRLVEMLEGRKQEGIANE